MAGFIKKNWQKDASSVLINAGLRAAGGFAGAYIATSGPFKAKPKNENQTLYNIGGPLLLAAGVLGDMMFEDQKIKSFAQGLTTYAALHSVAVMTKGEGGLAEKIGINGLAGEPEEEAALMSGIAALGTTTDSTAADVEEIKALAAGETGENDGNDWEAVANQIDVADETVKMQGVEEEPTAAELMGTESEDEAALLMGMF